MPCLFALVCALPCSPAVAAYPPGWPPAAHADRPPEIEAVNARGETVFQLSAQAMEKQDVQARRAPRAWPSCLCKFAACESGRQFSLQAAATAVIRFCQKLQAINRGPAGAQAPVLNAGAAPSPVMLGATCSTAVNAFLHTPCCCGAFLCAVVPAGGAGAGRRPTTQPIAWRR
jgi:hypothetical protein